MKEDLNEREVVVVDHIDHNNYEEYIGKTVKVTGDVDLSGLGLTKIPINFTEVGGYFRCTYNQLTSLVGSPKKVGHSFYCYDNKLTSLKGGPEEVGYGYECWNNKLTDLVGAPKEINGLFNCGNTQLTTLVGGPEKVGSFYCLGNKLSSLEGAPKEEIVGMCSFNPLRSTKDKPE